MPKIIVFRQKGKFKKTSGFLKRVSRMDLDAALVEATPKDTGKTAASWNYRVTKGADSIVITWSNTNVVDDVPIAVILQYGHSTRNGGYVEGVDYINPAMKPIFEEIARKAWREVQRG